MLAAETILQGRYRVIRQLGQGGMGAVYEAIDQRLDTTVALKETLFTDERLRKQFEREARLLARLHHPALPRVSDHFSEGDGQFLVMQFIEGDDLAETMGRKRGTFPVDQVLTWADQLLDALDYLHTQDPQIIHRDIKPQNLKLTSRGQIILLDFGLAKGQGGDVSKITAASIFGYTPNYAPLEQIQGLGTDTRSDLYSLAATLYHLTTGVKPPDALTRAAALVNGEPDPLQLANELSTAIDPSVALVLNKAMAQNREQRYATASEMRRALKRTNQTATIRDNTEAQTVLFATAAATVANATRLTTTPATVTGETTVVHKNSVVGPKRALPWALSAAAVLVLVASVWGFYSLKRADRPAELTPKPLEQDTPLAEPSSMLTVETNTSAPATRTPAKTEANVVKKSTEERKKPGNPLPGSSRERADTGHDKFNPPEPDAPNPDVNVPTFPGRDRPMTRVMPGGVVIRNFPDGSQIITTPNGTRILVTADGQRQVLRTNGRRRRRVPPTP
ncbi:MAG: serine/threonine-protein kinase [Pyrinomonadaceae bacterium]